MHKDSTEAFKVILGHSQDFIEAKVEFGKLKAIGKTADLTGTLIAGIFVFLISVVFIGMISLAAAQELSLMTHSKPVGFLMVGGFYGIMLLIVYLFRTKLITMPLSRIILKNLMH